MDPIAILGWFMLAIGTVLLGQVIIKPPVKQPPRALIGRTLMPISQLLFGVCMIIQPITAQTFILALVAGILSVVSLGLQLRYRPA